MGGMSPIHWVILGVIVLVLFGGGKISGMMGDLAKGIKSFKKGLEEDDHPAPPAKISSAQPAAENVSVAQAAQNPHPAQKQAAEQDAHFDGKS